MSARVKNGKQGAPDHPAEPGKAGAPTHFSFGARRYASNGPRRLFLPQKAFEFWMVEAEPEPSRARHRIFSTSV